MALGKLLTCVFLLGLISGPVFADRITIAAFGDSLTQGYGLPPHAGLVPQLEGWLHDNGADVTVLNAGVSGDTTAGGLARIEWTLTPEIDALIVTLGGNDLLRGIDPATARQNLEGILTVATEHDLPVLLVGLRAPTNFGADYKTAFDAIYVELAADYNTSLYLDLLAPLNEDRSTDDVLREFMQGDGIHPNAKGVKVIVAALGPSVQALIEGL